jgi:hypothetical protein
MKKIVRSKKYETGIQVFVEDKGEGACVFFSFPELIDLKINAFDLLQNPGIYRYDEDNKRIESSV